MAHPHEENNRRVAEEFRSNAGVVGGRYEGMPLALVTITGAKSHEQRVMPIACTKDGDRLIIVASRGGAPKHPSWFINIVANPDVTVEYGTEKFDARATIAEGAERDRLYTQHADQIPVFYEYQSRTTRRIPVVILERK